MSTLSIGMFLLGMGAGVVLGVVLWFMYERKPKGLRTMDQAEDFVNVLDDGTFKLLRTAVFLRVRRSEVRQASGAA